MAIQNVYGLFACGHFQQIAILSCLCWLILWIMYVEDGLGGYAIIYWILDRMRLKMGQENELLKAEFSILFLLETKIIFSL
jgi:hypothetical protein